MSGVMELLLHQFSSYLVVSSKSVCLRTVTKNALARCQGSWNNCYTNFQVFHWRLKVRVFPGSYYKIIGEISGVMELLLHQFSSYSVVSSKFVCFRTVTIKSSAGCQGSLYYWYSNFEVLQWRLKVRVFPGSYYKIIGKISGIMELLLHQFSSYSVVSSKFVCFRTVTIKSSAECQGSLYYWYTNFHVLQWRLKFVCFRTVTIKSSARCQGSWNYCYTFFQVIQWCHPSPCVSGQLL